MVALGERNFVVLRALDKSYEIILIDDGNNDCSEALFGDLYVVHQI